MGSKKYIINRKGKEEPFKEKILYDSCYKACLSSSMKPKKTEEICKKVVKQIKNWIKGKKEITTDQIFEKTIILLKKYSEDASFMYKTRRDIR